MLASASKAILMMPLSIGGIEVAPDDRHLAERHEEQDDTAHENSQRWRSATAVAPT